MIVNLTVTGFECGPAEVAPAIATIVARYVPGANGNLVRRPLNLAE